MLYKHFTKEQALEALLVLAAENIPDGIDGDISADYTEDGGVDIYFVPKLDEKELN